MSRRIKFVGDIERVHSVQINAMEVCGLEVPTKKSCEYMLNTLPNVESKLFFTAGCNGWVKTNEVKYNPHKYISIPESSIVEKLNLEPKNIKKVIKEIKLLARLIEIDDTLAEITGFNFAFLRQTKALMGWHQSLRGGYTGIDHQKIRKALSKQSKLLETSTYPLSIKSIPVKDYSHLLRVGKHETEDEYYLRNEYSTACIYLYRFSKAVDKLAITNSTIRELNIEEVTIMNRIVTNIESDPIDLLYRYCCPFCGKHEFITKRKKPKSCGSQECIDRYKPQWEEKNRPRTTSDPDGWIVAFDGKSRLCMGIKCDDGLDQGGRLRQVNVECLCRECYPESIDR